MRVLLDTHAFFWAVRDPTLLSDAARDVLLDTDTAVLVSAVTGYELAQKYRLGRMPEAADVLSSYATAVTALGARSLPVDDRHALAAGLLEWEHRDPFDRILVAQARAEGATLMSRDRAMSNLADIDVLW